MTESELTRALTVIDRLTGDDFCEALGMRLCDGHLDGELKTAAEKIGRIYRVAHSHLDGECYRAHTDWRKETEEMASAFEREES